MELLELLEILELVELLKLLELQEIRKTLMTHSLTQLLTTSNQEMLAHLKRSLKTFFFQVWTLNLKKNDERNTDK